MPKKVKTFKVLKPFEQDGQKYETGGEFAPPANWERLADHPVLHQDGQTLFGYRVQVGFSIDAKTGKSGRTPAYTDHTVVLPVVENA